jgi:2'-5' RNA ligase
MTRHNIGVAIRIPTPYRQQLQSWRERLGDPNAGSIVPHVTLLPPTLVRGSDLPAIRGHLAEVAAGRIAFRIRLRGSASFRPVSPVVFVPLVEGISDCEQLAAGVRSGPLRRSLRFPYHPHVTVAHDIEDCRLDRAVQELADYEARFTADRFCLFEQGVDGVWRTRAEFPLGTRE